ncbi:excinuclease ABC subunit UvrA, partial [Patescibacteria group bacterium]|nr:excinuclease ABC subunit UvrA [Patescibacteria group bacterium]
MPDKKVKKGAKAQSVQNPNGGSERSKRDRIIIKGARAHNLKNISLEIPKNKLVVVTGLSGSGKSSLAFDTIYAEGQRRYAESLSSYARQFMEVRDKPDVDRIDGLSPTIAIDQKIFTQNPRSTVGTVTEIYDYLRLLFARAGVQYCPDCDEPAESLSVGRIVEKVRAKARDGEEITILSPLVRKSVLDPKELLEKVEKSGLEKVRVNGEEMRINSLLDYKFEKNKEYDVELVMGKIENIKKQNPMALVEKALDLSNGLMIISTKGEDSVFSTSGLCHKCGKVLPNLNIRNFSFNSPFGACPRCTGLGVTMEVDPELVIPNPRLTLSEGAIQPWTRITGNQNSYQKKMEAVAIRHNFSMDTPVNQLSPAVLKLLMQGTGAEVYEVDGKKEKFSGIVADLNQRHLETNSEYVRKEIEQYMREKICPLCEGKRLRRDSLFVRVDKYNIADLSTMSVEESLEILKKQKFNVSKQKIAEPIIKEIVPRLENLAKVGLGYLSMDRAMNTLSGGEVTRVRLASQLSAGLTGVIYILDEPSVGLHPRDGEDLIATLKYLRDLGNTVIVVEHDEAMMKAADYLIDIGPGAGMLGGELMAEGTLAEIKKVKKSLTAQYLYGNLQVKCETRGRQKNGDKSIEIVGAKAFNLKNVDVKIPLGKLVCVTGVSGSGKSSLIIDVLGKTLSKHFYRAKEEPGA